MFLFSFSVLCKLPFLHLQRRRSFLILLRDYPQMGVLRGTHLKLGCFVVSYLQLCGGTTLLGASGAGRECLICPFSSWYNVLKPPQVKVFLLILAPIVGCLLFAEGSHPLGRLLRKCCCLYNVFTLLVSNFSELLQFKKSTWRAKTKNRDPLYGNSL